MATRELFVARFGESNAAAVEAAAEGHKNGVHDRPGSDPFRWAVAICLGYECFERFAGDHGITAPWAEVREWIKAEGNLRNHDGDVDYVSLLVGVYNEYVGEPVS